MEPSRYAVETFAPHLNTIFEVEVEPGTSLPFRLTEAERGPAHPKAVMFWLMFRGPVEPIYPQRLYHLKHAVLGEMNFFLVPVGHDGKGVSYQAVFNRVIPDVPAPRP